MFVEVYLLATLCANVLGVSQYDPEDPLILTPYVENGETAKAKELSKVDSSLFAGVNSHAAYFTVNKTGDWNLFFWYFPVQGTPVESTPLVISLEYGMHGVFNDFGPIKMSKRRIRVEKRTKSIADNYSLLCINNPVGNGFSFSGNREFATNLETLGANLVNFLQQFLQVFPELAKAPVFLFAEGIHIVYFAIAFAHSIHNNQNQTVPINLKGLIVGSALLDLPKSLYAAELLEQIGLVSPEQAAEINKLEKEARNYWDQGNFSAYVDKSDESMTLSNEFSKISFSNYVNNFKLPDFNQDTKYYEFLNYIPKIQEALHARTMDYPNHQNRDADLALGRFVFKPITPWLEEILEYYAVLCYNGQLDLNSAYPAAVRTYRSLKWSGAQGYLDAERVPFKDDYDVTKVNSYVRGSGKFMEVMIRGAGYRAFKEKTRETKQIIDLFISLLK